MKKYLIILIYFCVSCSNNQEEKFMLQVGDLLFQDLDSSPLCDAIELVTPGYRNGNFSHIGIVTELGNPFYINDNYNYNNHIRVLEAIPNKVTTTRLDSFLNRSYDKNNNPKVIVGRLKPQYKHTIKNAINFLKNKIDVEYDDAFIIDNSRYYCSELIYDAFSKDSIFQLQQMTFLHPETLDTLQIWKEYYTKLGMKIPQNKLGINPGIMSQSKKINIVHLYGIPYGMKNKNFTSINKE